MSTADGKTAAGLYYEERGSGAETLVWLPGFGQSIEIWENIIPAFEDHRSILFDLPGHAGSLGGWCLSRRGGPALVDLCGRMSYGAGTSTAG